VRQAPREKGVAELPWWRRRATGGEDAEEEYRIRGGAGRRGEERRGENS
jgi:hypothetical protein